MAGLNDQVVVITGASRGLGAAAARLFAQEGARVVLGGRNKERLRDAAEATGVSAERYLTVEADISTREGMKRLIGAAVERFGRIDVFVNNAGVGVRKGITETSEEEWAAMFGVNVTAVYYSFLELLPRFRAQGSGHIINVSSMASKSGKAMLAAYTATKAALNVLSEAVGEEVRNENIKVSVVMPGSIGTGFLTHMAEDRRPSAADKPRMTAEQVAGKIVEVAREDAGVWTSVTEMRPLRTRG